MLVGRSFARARAAVVVLVEGERGRAEEAFLLGRRRTAKAILLPSGSRLADRLCGEGSGGALNFLGGSDSIAALLDALGGAANRPAAPAAAAAARPTPNIPPLATLSENRPAGTATPVAARAFRYFSSSRPTRSPTPR